MGGEVYQRELPDFVSIFTAEVIKIKETSEIAKERVILTDNSSFEKLSTHVYKSNKLEDSLEVVIRNRKEMKAI